MQSHRGYLELMLAVLRQQIQDFLSGTLREDLASRKKGKDKIKALEEYRNRAERARDWILSNEKIYIFSFIVICKHVDLDPDKLRKKIMAIKYPHQVYDVYEKVKTMEPYAHRKIKYELDEDNKIIIPSEDPHLINEVELEPSIKREVESRIRKKGIGRIKI